jgi:hypothetical protein
MPCDSSYLAANTLEIEQSRMVCLLKELDTGVHVDTRSMEWDGYAEGVYNKPSRKAADLLASLLCERLGKMSKSKIAKCSLELQTWWRDHQRADLASGGDGMKKKSNKVYRGAGMWPGYRELNKDVLGRTSKVLTLGTPPGLLGPVEFSRGLICGREREGGIGLAYCSESPRSENGYYVPSTCGGVLTREQAIALYEWMTPIIQSWKEEQEDEQ